MGTCNALVFSHNLADLANGTFGVSWLILEFVKRSMTKMGHDKKDDKHGHKTVVIEISNYQKYRELIEYQRNLKEVGGN